MIKVGVYGATGYTGFELIRILRRHPDVSLTFATSESRSGARLRDVFPVPDDLPLISGEDADTLAAVAEGSLGKARQLLEEFQKICEF